MAVKQDIQQKIMKGFIDFISINWMEKSVLNVRMES